MSAVAESREFQAETSQLLELMTHSLYTNRDIFLRELISNASDALDRYRMAALVDPQVVDDRRLEIRIDVDPAARTLTITDTGIGMSRQEVIDNIGTIARSATHDAKRTGAAAMPADSGLIGQFGVGFYSVFMAASRVTLVTRKAGEHSGTEWQSSGGASYTLTDVSVAKPGTSITLHLLAPDADAGIADYTEPWLLKSIVRRYSDFISYPIVMTEQRSDPADPETILVEDATINTMKPIWTRPPSDVRPEEYADFYRYIGRDGGEPLETIHFSAEGTLQFQALLCIPDEAPSDLYYSTSQCGLRLFASRVMIVDKTEELLPRYLRFIQGIVDVSDLPLNISRQKLQQDRHIAMIRKHLTRRVVATLERIFDQDRTKYLGFWKQFGQAMKEGAANDFDNRDRLLPRLLFHSSAGDDLTTLDAYVTRMPADQDVILYLTGESLALVKNSPHLEAVRAKGWEVLYLTDPVDELLLRYLPVYRDKTLKSAAKGVMDLHDAELPVEQRERFADLLATMQLQLAEHVKQVRLTNRLTESPVCLVVDDHDPSPMLERLLHKGQPGGPRQRRVLEVNPHHPLVARLHARHLADRGDATTTRAIEILFALATLSEGSALPDAGAFVASSLAVLGDAL